MSIGDGGLTGEAWLNSKSKRREDIVLSGLVMPLGSIAVAGAAIYLAASEGSSPIFRQKRVGQDGREFDLVKLRTMPNERKDVPSYGHSDQRAGKFGRLIRKLRIDELPQVINIWNGQMSVVGPRPIVRAEVELMQEALNRFEFERWYLAYTAGRPGLLSRFGIRADLEELEPGTTDYYMARAEDDVHYYESATRSHDHSIIKEVLSRAVDYYTPGSETHNG